MCDTFNVTVFQRQDEEDARTVYVRNLHPKINEQQLREHFSMFGAIKRIVLPQDAHQIGSNRGFTFITFASKEPVEVACSLGKTLGGASVHLALESMAKYGARAMIKFYFKMGHYYTSDQ